MSCNYRSKKLLKSTSAPEYQSHSLWHAHTGGHAICIHVLAGPQSLGPEPAHIAPIIWHTRRAQLERRLSRNSAIVQHFTQIPGGLSSSPLPVNSRGKPSAFHKSNNSLAHCTFAGGRPLWHQDSGVTALELPKTLQR